jgi:aspartyl-tRNA(Asn)/glutamyl-tRNA(Gln) amidotransferase subunit C
MASVDIDVAYVAQLARLSLSPEEMERLSVQVRQVLAYVAKLSELDVSQVQPMAHAVPMINVTRADVVQPSLSQAEALRNAPAQSNGLFLVPKIVD